MVTPPLRPKSGAWKGNIDLYSTENTLLQMTVLKSFCTSTLQMIRDELSRLYINKVKFLRGNAYIVFVYRYLEDLAKESGKDENMKLLQGLTIAVETIGEVVAMYFSGALFYYFQTFLMVKVSLCVIECCVQ